MAEGVESSCMLEGTFEIEGKSCDVTLTSEAVKWRPLGGKYKDEVTIPINEILSVTTSTEKVKRPGLCNLQLVYIKHKKSHHLGRAAVYLSSGVDVCRTWVQNIQGQIDQVPTRPRRALVLINPISGNKKGPKLYRKIVAHVFTEASLQTHVIITENAGHVKDIINNYDLASIDSLVVMGGDGIYHLVVDALFRRLMREAGLDLDDTENDIPEVTLPIGVIPCGSGNQTALECFGCIDVETAALGIVRGGRQRRNLFGVWSGGEYVVCSNLLQGLGFMADFMQKADTMRYLGARRYYVLLFRYLLKGPVRVLDLDIEYRPPSIPTSVPGDPHSQPSPDASAPGEPDGANSEGVDGHPPGIYSQPWRRCQSRAVLTSLYQCDILGGIETGDSAHLHFSRLFLMKEWGRKKFLNFWRQLLIARDATLLTDDNILHFPIVEYKVTIADPEGRGNHAHIVNIDGEVVTLNKPELHVKLYPGKMNLFATQAGEANFNI